MASVQYLPRCERTVDGRDKSGAIQQRFNLLDSMRARVAILSGYNSQQHQGPWISETPPVSRVMVPSHCQAPRETQLVQPREQHVDTAVHEDVVEASEMAAAPMESRPAQEPDSQHLDTEVRDVQAPQAEMAQQQHISAADDALPHTTESERPRPPGSAAISPQQHVIAGLPTVVSSPPNASMPLARLSDASQWSTLSLQQPPLSLSPQAQPGTSPISAGLAQLQDISVLSQDHHPRHQQRARRATWFDDLTDEHLQMRTQLLMHNSAGIQSVEPMRSQHELSSAEPIYSPAAVPSEQPLSPTPGAASPVGATPGVGCGIEGSVSKPRLTARQVVRLRSWTFAEGKSSDRTKAHTTEKALWKGIGRALKRKGRPKTSSAPSAGLADVSGPVALTTAIQAAQHDPAPAAQPALLEQSSLHGQASTPAPPSLPVQHKPEHYAYLHSQSAETLTNWSSQQAKDKPAKQQQQQGSDKGHVPMPGSAPLEQRGSSAQHLSPGIGPCLSSQPMLIQPNQPGGQLWGTAAGDDQFHNTDDFPSVVTTSPSVAEKFRLQLSAARQGSAHTSTDRNATGGEGRLDAGTASSPVPKRQRPVGSLSAPAVPVQPPHANTGPGPAGSEHEKARTEPVAGPSSGGAALVQAEHQPHPSGTSRASQPSVDAEMVPQNQATLCSRETGMQRHAAHQNKAAAKSDALESAAPYGSTGEGTCSRVAAYDELQLQQNRAASRRASTAQASRRYSACAGVAPCKLRIVVTLSHLKCS